MSGVAVLGYGGIAASAHLPAYEQHGIGVVGVCGRPERTADVLERFPFVGRVYDDVGDLLSDPEVRVVDIATGPEGRVALVRRCLEAGKHVLAQKPVTLDAGELPVLEELVRDASRRGLRVAVNHNARWAPPWRSASLLLREGRVGEVVGVTHVHDKALPPLTGTHFDRVEHMLLTDYLLHWVDITRMWLLDGSAEGQGEVVNVIALDSRLPGQPADSLNPWSATIVMQARSGATATIRIPGSGVATTPGCAFWVHGTTGTLRGSVLLDSDRLSLDDGTAEEQLPLTGAWFVDGFAGAMGELLTAIAEDREPENSLTSAIASLRLMFAARDSAAQGGTPVTPLPTPLPTTPLPTEDAG
ncbi:Gfo/Idh/MocA family protein [Ornithinimicrobium pekingense]|uniref:NADH-dependent dehydrogenase n=1 Tax=Ornithinimicrobium pekingense TaxID=384677 RepID=A0ABQ2F859_9MICO|nr:Gfo/Idh/MocA family oxidoreductase [Ornithinimicrobium pekingense]GGK60684.1 NADH-dependent dehydrogenase [Ornithinimicrobium pekingense]